MEASDRIKRAIKKVEVREREKEKKNYRINKIDFEIAIFSNRATIQVSTRRALNEITKSSIRSSRIVLCKQQE